MRKRTWKRKEFSVANQVEQIDPLFQLLFCRDLGSDCPEFSDQQVADPLAKFFEEVALERTLAKTSCGSKSS